MSTDSECMRKGLAHLLVAATINKVVARHNTYRMVIPIDSFLTDLRLVIAQYKQVFQRPITSDVIDTKAELTRYLSQNSFKRFIAVKDDDVVIEADEETFVAELKSIVLKGVEKYSQFLLRNINDLAVLYRNCQDIPDVAEKEKTRAEDSKDEMEVENEEDDENADEADAELAETEVQSAQDLEKAAAEKNAEKDQGEDTAQTVTDSMEVDGNEEANTRQDGSAEELADDEVDVNESSENIEDEVKFDIPDIQEVEAEERAKKEAEAEKILEAQAEDEGVEHMTSIIVEDTLPEESKDEKLTETKDNAEDDDEEDVEKSRDSLRVKDSRKRSRSPSVSDPYKRFRAIATNLVREIQAHRYSSLFLQPVNEKEVPDYYDVIYEPKDLKNILKEVRSKSDDPQYKAIKELERDIMLMFANCIMYNHDDEDLVALTRSMRDDVVKSLKMFKDTEAEV